MFHVAARISTEHLTSPDIFRRGAGRVLLILLAVGTQVFAAIGSAADDALAVFPISVYPDALIIPARIAGAERHCLLDSGVSGYAFHTSFRQELGASKGEGSVVSSTGQIAKVEVFDAPIIRVGKLTISKGAHTSCLDLTAMREAEGFDFEGFLGMPVFRSAIVQMDFDAHRLVLLPAETAPKAEWGKPIYVSYDGIESPTIYVTFRDDTGDILGEECSIDTGYTGSLSLSSKLYFQLFDKQLIAPRGEFHLASASGHRSSREGMLRSMKINDMEAKDILVGDGGKQSRSRIGLNYLRRFRVTFDIPRDQIYLVKGVGFERPDRVSSAGIGLLRRNGKTLVAAVRPESPADKAGIIADDELVSVAGQAIADKSLAEIRWKLLEEADPNGLLALVCRRYGEDRKMAVKIRN